MEKPTIIALNKWELDFLISSIEKQNVSYLINNHPSVDDRCKRLRILHDLKLEQEKIKLDKDR